MDREVEDLITKAKVKLLLENPFFGYLILNFKFEPEKLDLGFIAVRRDLKVFVDEEQIKNLSKEQKDNFDFALAHEVLHVVLNHFDRMEFRDLKAWNVATDIVVNRMIGSDFGYYKLESLTGIDYNSFCSLFGIDVNELEEKGEFFAERVYELLQKSQGNSLEQGNTQGVSGNVSSFDSLKTGGEFSQVGLAKLIVEAKNYAKNMGKMSAGLEEVIDSILKPKVDWRRKLFAFFSERYPDDFTYSRLGKKSHLLDDRFRVPALLNEEKGKVLAVVDVSGSISSEELVEFVSEVLGIAKSFEIDGDLITHDVKPTAKINFKTLKLPLTIKGRGGTSHTWLEDENLKEYNAVVVFTDGYTERPKNIDKSKFLWVVNQKQNLKEFESLGKVVYYEN